LPKSAKPYLSSYLKADRQGPTEEQIDLYYSLQDEQEAEFRKLAQRLYDEEDDLDTFKKKMQDALLLYYSTIALAGKNANPLTDADKADLDRFLNEVYDKLDSFLIDLRLNAKNASLGLVLPYSVDRISWRASRYAAAWDRFSRFTVPKELFDALPAFPGIDCLGGPACGCKLVWEVVGDTVEVLWILDPLKEHCIICDGLALGWSPLVLTFGEDLPTLEEF
jgi:hypothetical protein